MRRLMGSIIVAASVVTAGCAGPEDVGTQRAALTSTDVDVAPECQGIITYANTASYQALDAFLPSNVASNIVGQRAVAPFTSLADLLAVDQVADYRLTQIEQAARTAGLVGTSCIGILDRLAVSVDDGQAMVALINTISFTQLHDMMPNAWNGAEALLNTRPFTTVQAIANTAGIGAVSLRAIRNAATLTRPFEQLAAAANAASSEVTLQRHFDWYAALHEQGRYRLNGMTCFGVDPNLVVNGATIRPNLADANEVLNEVRSTLSYANRFGRLTVDQAPGLANLEQAVAGRTFFGCYISYSNDPWSGNNLAFFVDKTTGLGVLSETRWSE